MSLTKLTLCALDAALELGGLHIVVNCAGVATAARVVGKEGPQPLADCRRVIEINLIGSFK